MNQYFLPILAKQRLVARKLVLFALAAAVGSLAWAQGASTPAQPSEQRMLTDAEVKARYRNCPRGYYSGPQPGKARYTKDHYIWAVTPAFAAKFCMPKEFISTELKGAEAVAYRMRVDDYEESCGFGGRAEVCTKPRGHWFEIYYPSGLLPKEHDVPYYHWPLMPSALLISRTAQERGFGAKTARDKPRQGAIRPFPGDSFTVLAMRPQDHLAIGHVGPRIHYQGVFEGLDYLAIEMAPGFTHEQHWKARASREFAIAMTKSDNKLSYYQIRREDFAVLISLPARMADAVINNDKSPASNFEALTKEALEPAGPPAAKK